jgi:hypothetical protein
MFRSVFFAACVLLSVTTPAAHADPQLTSWYTAEAGKYARIYRTTTEETNQAGQTVWSRGQGVQSLPTYAGVNEVSYSASWVYIRTTGLASHAMGPWYLNAAKTMLFPNYPSNTATIYRIPRAPAIPPTKTGTGLGAIGYFVNGVAFFDNRDAFSYSNANATDATPVNGITGDGIWNRNAYTNEAVTFDAALAHQAGKQYHYHVQPIALRYQLGDHVDYNATTNRYTESAAAVTQHSPIVAWAADGLPVYGPYGYSTALDAGSAVRRMISGYVLRDGSSGTTNLTATGRHTLPAWAAAVQNKSTTLTANQYGPNVDATYALGHYLEDYDYLGDPGAGGGNDLDRYNCRYCKTPEFPNGTYAYFSTLDAAGAPAFPYNIGRQFFGSPTGSTVATISETTTRAFDGGPNIPMSFTGIARNSGTGAVTVSWSSVDGATYRVDATGDFSAWTVAGASVASGGTATSFTETPAQTQRFYRATRTALATYDNSGYSTSTSVAAAEAASVSGKTAATTDAKTVTSSAGRAVARPMRRPGFGGPR